MRYERQIKPTTTTTTDAQETAALLEILVLGNKLVQAGQVYPLREAIERIRRSMIATERNESPRPK